MKNKKILVLCSAATHIPLQEGGSHPTGNFLGELTEPLEALIEVGTFDFAFATPGGRPISIDENSYKLMYWGFQQKNVEWARVCLSSFMKLGLDHPLALEKVAAGDLSQYDALFVPGGHGPMIDLLHVDFNAGPSPNPHTSKILHHFHSEKKTTALICHAPAILACAPGEGRDWIYHGYRMTCVSQFSEWMTEDFPLTKVIHGHIKEYPTPLLRSRGAVIEQTMIPMVPKVVKDRELITGQDPYSGKRLGLELLKTLTAN